MFAKHDVLGAGRGCAYHARTPDCGVMIMEQCMRKYLALGTLAALGLTTQAFAADAEGFSYNLIEGSYIDTEIEGIDGDGFGVSGSVEFNQNVFGFGSINDIDYEGGVGSSQLSLGVGVNWALSPVVDLVGGLSYERIKLSVSGLGSESEDGYGLNLGLRGRVGDALELSAGVNNVDLGADIDDTTLQAAGRYYFTPAFAVGLDVSDNDDGTAFGLSVRYDFGNRF